MQDYDPQKPLDEHVGLKELREVATSMAFMDNAAPRDDASRSAVQLMTLHKAKGLEFSVVFLVGLDEGALPTGDDADLQEVEQKQNLVYVGVTRTRNLLIASGVEQGALQGQKWGRGPTAAPPSLFLKAMYNEFNVKTREKNEIVDRSTGGRDKVLFGGYPLKAVRFHA
jgi:superfamily I DNA/RNA helicase